MNTVKSFWVGMAALTAAGGGAYYFAKQQINADRAEKFERDQRRRRQMEALEYSSKISSPTNSLPPVHDPSGSPSLEQTDPAPTQHAPDSETAKVLEKSKYEASEPFRARKGDRFS